MGHQAHHFLRNVLIILVGCKKDLRDQDTKCTFVRSHDLPAYKPTARAHIQDHLTYSSTGQLLAREEGVYNLIVQ
jgi:hypothetical protein